LHSVRRVQRSLGRHSRAGHGAAIGAELGGALGLAFDIAVSSDEFLSSGASGGGFAAVVPFTAATGGAVGALLGALSHHERWRDLDVRPARRLSVQLKSATRRVGLTVAIGRAPG
jgi:hypothetical protein